jgi:hypothetical protein
MFMLLIANKINMFAWCTLSLKRSSSSHPEFLFSGTAFPKRKKIQQLIIDLNGPCTAAWLLG